MLNIVVLLASGHYATHDVQTMTRIADREREMLTP
jgi:hypothetical protein